LSLPGGIDLKPESVRLFEVSCLILSDVTGLILSSINLGGLI